MTTHEATDQVISMTLKGIETLAKISGAGAKNIAVYLYAVLNDQKKTKGKARLASMLKSGKELKIFAVKKDDLASFVREAKKYGVLYAVLKDKKDIDGMCDIMVRSEDGAKINRIVERFKFATVDMADIKTEIAAGRGEENPKKSVTQKEGGSPSEASLLSRGDSAGDFGKASVKKELEAIKQEQIQKTKKIKIKPQQR